MGSAGYGNHEEATLQIGESAPPEGVAKKPEAGGTGPGSGKPDSTAAVPDADNRREGSTPGAGALPGGGPQGGDVDPGVG